MMSTRATSAIVAGATLALIAAGLACANSRPTRHSSGTEFGIEACAELPEHERRASPLEAPYTIESITSVHRYLWTGRGVQRRPLPGTGKMISVHITLRTPTWTTLEALQQRLQCHITWMHSSGDELPAVRSCPLAVPGTSAEVRMGYGQRYIIAINSKNERAAKEAWRRARALFDGANVPETEDSAD